MFPTLQEEEQLKEEIADAVSKHLKVPKGVEVYSIDLELKITVKAAETKDILITVMFSEEKS